MFAMRFATLLFILPSISCNEVRNKDDGEEKATKTRHILCHALTRRADTWQPPRDFE